MSEDVEIPTRHTPTRDEIQEDSDYWMTNDMMNRIHGELLICKTLIDDIMEHSGWDAAYFNVEIDLKVRFDNSTVRVREAWRKMEP